jgi:hypothetical protein
MCPVHGTEIVALAIDAVGKTERTGVRARGK